MELMYQRRVRPKLQRHLPRAAITAKDLCSTSPPLKRCGYRAPLTPRLHGNYEYTHFLRDCQMISFRLIFSFKDAFLSM